MTKNERIVTSSVLSDEQLAFALAVHVLQPKKMSGKAKDNINKLSRELLAAFDEFKDSPREQDASDPQILTT